MAKEKDDVIIAFRAPTTLRDIVKEFVLLDTHMNESDFYRDAVRQKVQKEAPRLYKRLFEKEKEPEKNESG